jgi:hypothetical protein
MANSATCHPIPERAPESTPANDATFMAPSELALSLVQFARNERPSQAARDRILKACGIR